MNAQIFSFGPDHNLPSSICLQASSWSSFACLSITFTNATILHEIWNLSLILWQNSNSISASLPVEKWSYIRLFSELFQEKSHEKRIHINNISKKNDHIAYLLKPETTVYNGYCDIYRLFTWYKKFLTSQSSWSRIVTDKLLKK